MDQCQAVVDMMTEGLVELTPCVLVRSQHFISLHWVMEITLERLLLMKEEVIHPHI